MLLSTTTAILDWFLNQPINCNAVNREENERHRPFVAVSASSQNFSAMRQR
eukprot:m.146782 g.146782  ORF g.146782 m.146782 type:complete len:51 (-) comp52716_c1_seq25:11-163(-)